MIGLSVYGLSEGSLEKTVKILREVDEKQRRKLDRFDNWLMTIEEASPKPLPIWNELKLFFNFVWRADPNRIIDEFTFDDQLLPQHRNTVIEFMMFPFIKKFHCFMFGLSKEFSSALLQKVKPRM